MTKVLAFTKYGGQAASTRQRLLQFVPDLEKAGFQVETRPFFDDDYVQSLTEAKRYPLRKVLRSYLDRLIHFSDIANYDLVWVYAELVPYLPAIVEKLATRSSVPLIYDFDDAFFHIHERKPFLRDKLRPVIGRAMAVTAGNSYLAEYARRWNSHVHVMPTVVDTDVYCPMPRSAAGPVTIGWIGSPSTWQFVRPILPLLRELAEEGKAKLLVVGAGMQATPDFFNGIEARDWSEETEVRDIQDMDIGIMPLPDEPWARGKCGYKLIQYMACGLPTIASPVGVNSKIVVDRETGLLASTDREWREALNHLLDNRSQAHLMGRVGRERVVRDYSLISQAPRLVEIFISVMSRRLQRN